MKRIATMLAVVGLSALQSVQADNQNQVFDQIMSGAQNVFPQYFSFSSEPQTAGPWCYIFSDLPMSSGGNVILGLNQDTDGIYVAGGPFGGEPVYVGQANDILAALTSDNELPCDAAQIPEGLNISRNGSELTMTTDGCIELPENSSFCTPNADPSNPVTGIHTLTETTVDNFQLTGLTASIPGVVENVASQYSNQKTCIINAPAGFVEFTVNLGPPLCFDITNQLGDLAQLTSSGFVQVTPPVTITLEGTSASSVVANCLDTDAILATDAATGEVLARPNADSEWTVVVPAN